MIRNNRFREYFYENFFKGKEDEFEEFISSLEKPIKKTIRIKPGKEDSVKQNLEKNDFLLSETIIPNVFFLERKEDFRPLERRIGYSLDHLIGNFYIQELAAATSVYILSDGKIDNTPYTILDMAASPGGKTTQLSEYYPESFIIANEPTRERIPQLLQNLDRMGSANIGVTLYPGQYFHHTPEVFDRILLDAPCSGEGTLYKGTDATRYWHIKNIKNIATLQTKLLDAAIIALKVGGEMVYSTCSMNLLENEGVLESIKKKYPEVFSITYQKRFWPHIDGTGGFFIAKIKKYSHIEKEENKKNNSKILYNEKLIPSKHNIGIKNRILPGYMLYEYDRNKILTVKRHPKLEEIRKRYYFMRFGEEIGKKESNNISIHAFGWRYMDCSHLRKYTIQNEEELDIYLRGGELRIQEDDGPILLIYEGSIVSLEEVLGGVLSNSFPHNWRRR